MTLLSCLRLLLRDRSGVAMTEFALTAPFVLTFGLWGIETSNLALTHMKVSQLAMHVADNASRIGDTSTLENRKIYEEDILDLLLGANVQGGASLDLFEHGRVIISSLEVYDESVHKDLTLSPDTQFIHWQRCKGALNKASDFGNESSVMATGIGPSDSKISASTDMPVIFVEVSYDYQPLVSASFVPNTRITATSAFVVRDSRDLSELYQLDTTNPIASCSVYDSFTTP
jgi:hypothetical protein